MFLFEVRTAFTPLVSEPLVIPVQPEMSTDSMRLPPEACLGDASEVDI